MKKVNVDLTETELETLLLGLRTLSQKADEYAQERFRKLENSLIAQAQMQEDHLVTAKCLFSIVDGAKIEMSNLTLPLQISGKDIEQVSFVHICIANSLFSYLNRNQLLKRLPRFDITDSSLQFETNDE